MNLEMFKLVLEKAEEPEIKLPTSAGSSKKQEFQKNIYFCFIDGREPETGTPLMAKVMRKEARHMQRRDRASGVPLDILEHLPPKNQSLPTSLLCALTSDFTGGCPPPPSHSL